MSKEDYFVQRSYRYKMSLLKKLEKLAEETNKSKNEIVNKALEQFFNQIEKEKKY